LHTLKFEIVKLAQEADGSLSGRMENSCPRVFFIR